MSHVVVQVREAVQHSQTHLLGLRPGAAELLGARGLAIDVLLQQGAFLEQLSEAGRCRVVGTGAHGGWLRDALSL